MSFAAILLPLLAAATAAGAAAAGDRPVVVTGHVWAPFISPMGEPFRPRSAADDTLADWFAQADRNHDGVLTADEMVADAERFFATLDLNHDGEIDPDELVHYEWEIAPDIQVNAKTRRGAAAAAAAPRKVEPALGDDGDIDEPHHHRARDEDVSLGTGGLEGAARYALLNIPEPVAAADTDFNRAITLAEFRAAAIARFQLLDSARSGRLGLAQLEALLPKLPPNGAKPKPSRDKVDTRLGNPLPPGH